MRKTLYTHEIQTTDEMKLTSKKFLKKSKEFLLQNNKMKENEILYIVKATMTSNGDVVAYGAYYGIEMSPLNFLVTSEEYKENVSLAEVTSKEGMIEYLLNNKNEETDENIYLFKVLYEDFKLCKIESFYGGKNALDFYIFDEYDEEQNRYGKVLKRFGKIDYIPDLLDFL